LGFNFSNSQTGFFIHFTTRKYSSDLGYPHEVQEGSMPSCAGIPQHCRGVVALAVKAHLSLVRTQPHVLGRLFHTPAFQRYTLDATAPKLEE